MSRRHYVKVFSATMAKNRDMLGETVTNWIADQPNLEVDEIRSHQSSDSEFHCLSIIVLGTVPA